MSKKWTPWANQHENAEKLRESSKTHQGDEMSKVDQMNSFIDRLMAGDEGDRAVVIVSKSGMGTIVALKELFRIKGIDIKESPFYNVDDMGDLIGGGGGILVRSYVNGDVLLLDVSKLPLEDKMAVVNLANSKKYFMETSGETYIRSEGFRLVCLDYA